MNSSKIYKFQDYAPHTFYAIRKIFGLDSDDYLSSIGPDRLLSSILMG